MIGTEWVKWYCHSCGKTHTHTIEQRDAHRDDLRRREMYLIDEARRLQVSRAQSVERS